MSFKDHLGLLLLFEAFWYTLYNRERFDGSGKHDSEGAPVQVCLPRMRRREIYD